MLQDKVRLLTAITDNASVALFIMDERQQCVFMNPAAERMTGYRLDEVTGRPLHDVIHHKHPDGRHYPLEDCPIDRAFPERNCTQGEEVFVHKNGQFYDVSFTASPIRGDEGQPIGTIIEVQDITERKRREQAAANETELLEILNQTATLIGGELDIDRLLQDVTDSATRLTGAAFGAFFYNGQDEQGEAYLLYTLSGAPKSAFEHFGHPRPTPMFAPTFQGGPAIRIDDVTKDPRYGQWAPHHGMPKGHLPVRSYLAVSVISRRGDVIGGLFFGHPQPGMFTERTERLAKGIAGQASAAVDNARLYAEAQRAMRQRDALLESERTARREAESASRVKDQFLATLSHELRTPLSAILGWLHILRFKGTSDPAALQKGLDVIERSARTQHELVEELLDMSRITTGKLHLELSVVEVASVVNAAVDLVQPSAAAARVALTVDNAAGTTLVRGDSKRLQQAVSNLLSNSVKFTPPGGSIDVTIRRDGEMVSIAVRDTGKGIRSEYLPFLFDRFRQADQSTSRRFGGLGLGLALVHQLVQLHSGSVDAHSPGEGQGSTFTIHLPVTTSIVDEPERAVAEASIEPFEGRILLIEDDAAGREFLERMLTEAGATVVAVAETTQAREALVREDGFDLILSDIGLPGEDGYGFMRWLRRQPAPLGDVRSIALTAFARPQDIDAARQAGFDEHLAKPVNPMHLMQTIRTLTCLDEDPGEAALDAGR
ncbi:ATP-binding protein [Piscinibacter sakaiensis]|uniref:PAS domain-containing hybrid sensor histidine kinase/response regulator n=1 Tax=Piscinibacter sakaiensis TaxID=1547922 RepID=UPI003AAA27A5